MRAPRCPLAQDVWTIIMWIRPPSEWINISNTDESHNNEDSTAAGGIRDESG